MKDSKETKGKKNKITKGEVLKLICIEVGMMAVGMIVVPPVVKKLTNKYYRMSLKSADKDYIYEESDEYDD